MSLTTGNIIDIAVLAFILIKVIAGAIRGAFKSVIGLVVLGVSVFLGYYISPMLTPGVVDWVYPKISDKLTGLAAEKLGMAAELISAESLESTVKPVLNKPARIVLWVIISVVALLILDIIAKLINKAIKNTPILKGANRGLGAVIGLVVSFAVCFGLTFAISAVGLSDYAEQKTDGSVSYQFFSGLVPKRVKNESGVINIPVIGEVNVSELFMDKGE